MLVGSSNSSLPSSAWQLVTLSNSAAYPSTHARRSPIDSHQLSDYSGGSVYTVEGSLATTKLVSRHLTILIVHLRRPCR